MECGGNVLDKIYEDNIAAVAGGTARPRRYGSEALERIIGTTQEARPFSRLWWA